MRLSSDLSPEDVTVLIRDAVGLYVTENQRRLQGILAEKKPPPNNSHHHNIHPPTTKKTAMTHTVAYNSQRDNRSFGGRIPGNVQCFATCAWMFMSFFDDKIDATDDEGLRDYLDDIESSVGSEGSAEDFLRHDDAIRDAVEKGVNSMFFWKIHVNAINKRFSNHYDRRVCRFQENITLEQLNDALSIAPVILGTSGLGRLRGGHVILLLNKDPKRDGYRVHDPYGDARTHYNSHDGANVFYSTKRILAATGNRRDLVSRAITYA